VGAAAVLWKTIDGANLHRSNQFFENCFALAITQQGELLAAACTTCAAGVAAGAFRTHARTYPVGAVIVKEKAAMPAPKSPPVASPPSLAGKPLALNEIAKRANGLVRSAGSGGMIKRAPGYDPEHGDWEYLYFTDPEHVEHGKLLSCVQCHEAAQSTDRVYGFWAMAHR